MIRPVASLLSILLLAAPCHPPRVRAADAAEGGYRAFTADVMATRIEILLPDTEDAPREAGVVFGVFRDVDAEMSEWKEGSPLSAVNRAAGHGWVRVPPDLCDLLRRGVEIGDMTGGAFDITWAALWGLWDFKAVHPRVPEAAEVRRRAQRVDYRQLAFSEDGASVRLLREGMLIGLGGIAKGYALGRAADSLRAHGVRSFLISGGGQIYAGGTRGGEPWRIGIRDPRGAPDDYFAQLEVQDLSTSTSGDYERYFIADGVRYHHILDPRTGMPARGLRSVTVLSADATLADALSTAIMVMGRERGLALADSLPGVEAVLVDDRGEVHTTPGAAQGLVIRHAPQAE